MKYVFVRYGRGVNGRVFYDHTINSWQVYILEGRQENFLFDNKDSAPNSEGVFEVFEESMVFHYVGVKSDDQVAAELVSVQPQHPDTIKNILQPLDIACKRLLVALDGFHIDTIRCMLVMASNKGSHGFQIAMQDPKDPSFVHIVTYKPPADGEPGEIEWHAESMRSWAEEPHQTCHVSQLLMAGINKYLGRK